MAKAPVKKTAKPIDTAQKKKVAVKKVIYDSIVTLTENTIQDSVKKKAVKKTVKPTDSLVKKAGAKKTVKPTDSLMKKAGVKKTVKPADSLAKKAAVKKTGKTADSATTVKLPKGWFEISGSDSTDIRESLLKKNAEEWFTDWFSITNERNQGFKASVADSINRDRGYYLGHGTYAMKDTLSQNRISSIKMDYKTEVKVKGKSYQYRFYDFKIKSTLLQNGKVISDEMVDMEAEKEQTKDQYHTWRLKKLQNEMQNILDNFQSMMQQEPQRLNAFE
ncbi:hypothetical protein D3C80_699210 [compost metagenome]